jgi:hypothetical protein
MSDERTEEFSEPRLNIKLAVAEDRHDAQATHHDAPEATASSGNKPGDHKPGDKEQATKSRAISAAKVHRQSRLPALDDDADVGVEKEHIVTRDGKADLLFLGALLASAAPASAPSGTWHEYRIYRTSSDKHVFSKVTRNLFEDQDDTYEAEIFDPAPASVPSQLMRSAREIARQRPMTWMDAAVAFFGYDPLAKVLYRKLSVRFEEQIS